ncbi:L,D-transpeptidase family protein, partial [Olsenella sp. DSM 107455]
YYYDARGEMVRGWLDLDGKRYRLDIDDGHLWTGWYTVDGLWYYGREDGSILTGSGWVSVDGRTFYLDPGTGAAHRGWLDLDGKRYRLDIDDGHLWTGWYTVDGLWYYGCEDGSIIFGWLDLGDRRFRLDRDRGFLWIGWFDVDGSWYYSGSDGAIYRGRHVIDGVTYDFGEDGKVTIPPGMAQMASKAQRYGSGTNYLVMIDTSNNYLGVFTWNGSAWTLSKYWRCSSGAPSSPTVTGQYVVGAKGYSFGHGYTCYYYTQFFGDYLIHSIKYYPGTFNVMDGRLGMNISLGCVRLSLDHAKWIYDNIPRGTTVVTYR